MPPSLTPAAASYTLGAAVSRFAFRKARGDYFPHGQKAHPGQRGGVPHPGSSRLFAIPALAKLRLGHVLEPGPAYPEVPGRLCHRVDLLRLYPAGAALEDFSEAGAAECDGDVSCVADANRFYRLSAPRTGGGV